MITYYSSIVTICLSLSALISQKSGGHVAINAPTYCRNLTYVMQYSLRSIGKPSLKCPASSAPNIWPGSQNVEMGHVTLTTPTWGIVSHQKGNTASRDRDHAHFRDTCGCHQQAGTCYHYPTDQS